jgi:hypothetical protein
MKKSWRGKEKEKEDETNFKGPAPASGSTAYTVPTRTPGELFSISEDTNVLKLKEFDEIFFSRLDFAKSKNTTIK